ncbi:uncharacterized protein [Lepeophtheirus salmonis]|uniref:uncharacterized protein n=1 Tax=Lepeophtheirus salmonis TaxID=72036 RepID=UPI001AE250C7|nr:uncharacterized protein LOC121120756 [Lepeophtheirus salmonis]
MKVKTLLLSVFLLFGITNGNTSDQLKGKISNASSIVKRAIPDKLEDLTRAIIIDEDKLPGIDVKDGQKCVQKIIQVQETEYDRGLECQHTFKKKCHVTYVTDFSSAPERRCETTFKKNCHISFKAVPYTEKVKKCHTPYTKKCGDEIQGELVCKDIYEDFCETRFKKYDILQDEPECELVKDLRCKNITIDLLHIPHDNDGGSKVPYAVKETCENWPKQKCELKKKTVQKIHPKTECKKVSREVCAPENCETLPGEEICHEDSQTRIQNIPEENCDLEPEENCRLESTLVPKLVPKENCVKVPKEICVNTKKNPKTITKPILKNWCYDPKKLSGNVDKL